MKLERRWVLVALVSLVAASGAARAEQDTGPTFSVADAALGKHVTVIVCGDKRFHDPSNTKVTNPTAREELVERIEEEKPSAIQFSGDVPYKGSDPMDYVSYKNETAAWRAAGLRVYR